MARVVLFPSVLGVGSGLHANAGTLEAHGHFVIVVDPLEGRTFERYESAVAYVDSVDIATHLARALEMVEGIPDGFVVGGFSFGRMLATYVAAKRRVRGLLLFAGSVDPAVLGMRWPTGVPAQQHDAIDDPWREQAGIDAVRTAAEASGASVETFDYPGSGHLFADPSRSDEFQPDEAELTWSRVLAFLQRHGH